MWPSFQYTVLPHVHKRWYLAYYMWPIAHGALGAFAELFGIYIALVAGTNLLPAKLKFHRWKFWMRFELALWWLVLLMGLGTYSLLVHRHSAALAPFSEVGNIGVKRTEGGTGPYQADKIS